MAIAGFGALPEDAISGYEFVCHKWREKCSKRPCRLRDVAETFMMGIASALALHAPFRAIARGLECRGCLHCRTRVSIAAIVCAALRCLMRVWVCRLLANVCCDRIFENGGVMNYSEIKYFDIANGEGVRTSLFVSGCRHGCPGCFNPDQWDFTAGQPFSAAVQDKIIESLAPEYVDGLTLLGGEPMEPENQRALVDFVERVRQTYPGKTIWCFTGDLLEDLRNPDSPRHTEVTDRLLAAIDVLVDGPFVQAHHDITLRFRGSSNQRVIDLPASLAAGKVMPWRDDPQFTTHVMVSANTKEPEE